jgi:hypothetical protein
MEVEAVEIKAKAKAEAEREAELVKILLLVKHVGYEVVLVQSVPFIRKSQIIHQF